MPRLSHGKTQGLSATYPATRAAELLRWGMTRDVKFPSELVGKVWFPHLQWGKWHSQSVCDARGPEHFNVTLGILINCK